MSINTKKLKPQDKKDALNALHALANNIKGKNPVVKFIDQLLTESEQITIGRRALVAQMLLSGHSRNEIKQTLGMSPNTFSRTRKWLERQLPNYDEALKTYQKGEKQKKVKERQKRKEYLDPISFATLKRKYPGHFLLFNLIEELTNR